MKIGLLTFHFPDNFGAVLQTFALERFFENKLYDVSIINCVPREIEKKSFFVRSLRVRHILGNVVRLFLYPFYMKRKRLFQIFRENNLKIGTKSGCEIDFSFYDVICTGSDQTFNLNYPFTSVYYQIFKKRSFQKKIAYAPSFGSYDVSLLSDEMIDALKDFDGLSCRESDGALFLSEKTGRSVKEVLDPVFLLSKKEWLEMLRKRPFKENYIFVYDLNGKETLVNLALKHCKEKRVVVFSNDLMFSLRYKHRYRVSFVKCLSVEDFLTYIYYADSIFTDSFHGTAFSIIFQKQFNTYIALKNASTRIYSLLERLNLKNRIVETDSVDKSMIDYDFVSERLKECVSISKDFFKENDL